MAGKPLDLTGQKFHLLTAIKLVGSVSRAHDPGRSDAQWLWSCECGTEIIALGRAVRRGFKKSCGCHVRRGWKTVAWRVYNGTYTDGDITFEQFIELSQQPCFYCGAEKCNDRNYQNNSWSYNGLDRLTSTKPHNLDNCVPCCWECNERKSNTEFSDFMNWISKVYQNRLKV